MPNAFLKKIIPKILTLSVLLSSGQTAAEESGAYLFDAQRTNISYSEITLPLSKSWKKSIVPFFYRFKRKRTEVVSSPVIYDTTLYVGGKNKAFYALDINSGKTLWKFKLKSNVDAPSAVTEKIVSFGTLDGTMYSLDRATGKEFWHASGAAEILSSPVITNGNIYFSSSDANVYAFNAESGEKLWQYAHETAHYVMSRFYNSLAASDDKLFCFFPDGYVVSLDLITGKELWKKKVLNERLPDSRVRRTPLYHDGSIYIIGEKGAILSLDENSGERKTIYERDVEDGGDRSGATDFLIKGDDIYVADGENLLSLKYADGEALWKKRIGYGTIDSVFAAGNVIFVISDFKKSRLRMKRFEKTYGYVSAYDMTSAGELWGKRIPAIIRTNGVVGEDSLAIVTIKGTLIVFAPR